MEQNCLRKRGLLLLFPDVISLSLKIWLSLHIISHDFLVLSLVFFVMFSKHGNITMSALNFIQDLGLVIVFVDAQWIETRFVFTAYNMIVSCDFHGIILLHLHYQQILGQNLKETMHYACEVNYLKMPLKWVFPVLKLIFFCPLFLQQQGVYGTCMPKQCTEHDVGSIYQSIFNRRNNLKISTTYHNGD